MPKLNPYLIENKKPIELVKEIEDYQIKKTTLSPAALVKVINKSGSNYVSENKDYYGPGNSSSSDFGFSDSFESFEREQRNQRRNERFNEAALFVTGTALKATAATTLTVATGGLAPVLGGGAWIGGKWLESTNDEFLQFLGRTIGDLGGDMFSGGLFSSSSVGEFARKNGIDLKKLENLFEAKGRLETGYSVAKHNKHKNEGISYKSDCDICRL